MELTTNDSPTAAITLGARDTFLTDRAANLLTRGPASSMTVVREVCQLTAVPAALADHLAVALLAADGRFARGGDGAWTLAPITSVALDDDSLDGTSFVVVDVEATGTRALDGDRITEVAVVQVKNGQSRVLFESLINPDRHIPAFISSLTNITPEMVRAAPRFAEVAPQIAGALEGSLFVAHNAAFDWRFLSVEMQRATGRPLSGTRLCTVKMARRLVPTLRQRSLDHIADFFGITITARHRAGGDAVATAAVLRRLLDKARDLSLSTVDELRAYLRAPRKKRFKPSAMPRVDVDTVDFVA
jgi:DNA polymerase-3 subunit epsilon